MNNRNHSIDLLRFIASSWVVLFHLNEAVSYVDNPYRNFVKLGSLGVPIFFVVSGYCIGMAAKNSRSAVDFMYRRFFRIFPAYWFSLAVTVFCIFVYAVINGHNSVAVLPKAPKSLVATLFLGTEPFLRVKTINWVYWSLTVEVLFYLVIGVSMFLHRRFRNGFLLFVSLCSFIPGITAIPGLFFLQQWPSFGIGLALYELQVTKQNKLLPILLMAANSINLFVCLHATFYPVVSFASLGVIAISIFWRDLPDNRISRLGDYSYAVYLLHVPIGIYMMGNLKTGWIQTNLVFNIVFDVSILLVMLVISSFVFKYIELPGIQWGKRWAKKKETPQNKLTAVGI